LPTPSTFSGLFFQIAALTVAMRPVPLTTETLFHGSPTQ
jgi:hypothetical protein